MTAWWRATEHNRHPAPSAAETPVGEIHSSRRGRTPALPRHAPTRSPAYPVALQANNADGKSAPTRRAAASAVPRGTDGGTIIRDSGLRTARPLPPATCTAPCDGFLAARIPRAVAVLLTLAAIGSAPAAELHMRLHEHVVDEAVGAAGGPRQ
ncbi:hypothetical protein IFM12276_21150 [Nocardia sputorum]|uniref:Uncharacterized protein n=1 Tax=Nocardia sputorum TaxID=2984338 RepID=A0ABM8CVT2_9NOCA|nr:hypothetical protein IFM12276_21150 [Nocardia sputorum]